MSQSLEQVRPKVEAFLNKQQLATLQRVGVTQMIMEVRLWVPEVKGVSEKDLRALVVGYYLANRLLVPTWSNEKIEKAVEGAVEVPGKAHATRDGLDVKVSLSGLTVDLKRKFEKTTLEVGASGVSLGQTGVGGDKVTVSVGWDKAVSIATSSGGFYLTGVLGKDRWELKLSYPSDTPIPDLSKLGQVFGEGLGGLWEVGRATPGILELNPKDLGQKYDAVSPKLDKVKKALDAAQGIKDAKKGLSLGVKFGSPDPHPGDEKIQPGLQGTVTLTVVF